MSVWCVCVREYLVYGCLVCEYLVCEYLLE